MKYLWKIRNPENEEFFLDYWCQLAYETHLPPVGSSPICS